MNILTVASQYIFENVMYVKKNINNVIKIGDIHNINTRNRLNLGAPVTRLHRIRNFFMGQCVLFYNRIPENVREFSISRFKKKMKSRLCIKGYYQINYFVNDNTPWE